MRACALLPLRVLWLLGSALGFAFYLLHRSRRRIVDANLRACFPHLSRREHDTLVRRHFLALGRGVFDVAIAWWSSKARLGRLVVRTIGKEHYDAALASGRNVILLAPHFVAMEVGGMYLSRDQKMATLYKKTKNAVFNLMYRRIRARFGGVPIEQGQGLKPVVRAIREGRVFYYLPDQDLGPRLSVFAPFFGVAAATVPALGGIARLGNAVVLPFFTRQLPCEAGYEIIFRPPLDPFPTGDEHADTARMNREIEHGVLLMPEQYFWVHKRFKTRPAGEADFYS